MFYFLFWTGQHACSGGGGTLWPHASQAGGFESHLLSLHGWILMYINSVLYTVWLNHFSYMSLAIVPPGVHL